MKKPIVLVLGTTILATSLMFTACSDDKKTKETGSDVETESTSVIGDTLGSSIYAAFLNTMPDKDNVLEAAEAIATEDITGYNCVTAEIQPGFLNGFTSDITGFNEGAMFAPVIGSVPFVGYIFETDDPDSLKDTLLANCDPRWNICTEADETFCQTYENYVFFVMCPNE